MDALVDAERREALVEKIRDEAQELREKPEVVDDSPPTTDDSVRSSARTDAPIPEPPFWGVREIDVDLDDVYPYLDRHVLFKLHWGGRGKKGEEWRQIVEGHDGDEGFSPKLERMWREQDYLHPQARLGYFPCSRRRQRARGLRSRRSRQGDRAARLPAPAQARPHLPGRLLPAAIDSGERDVVAIQGVTVGPEVTDVMAKLEKDGEFAEQLFTHGLGRPGRRGPGRVAARRGPPRARHRPRPGPPLLLGLPGLPGPVRAREGLAPARPGADRHDPLATATP